MVIACVVLLACVRERGGVMLMYFGIAVLNPRKVASLKRGCVVTLINAAASLFRFYYFNYHSLSMPLSIYFSPLLSIYLFHQLYLI